MGRLGRFLEYLSKKALSKRDSKKLDWGGVNLPISIIIPLNPLYLLNLMLGRLPAQHLPKCAQSAHFYFKKYFPLIIFSFLAVSIACTVISIAFALPEGNPLNGLKFFIAIFISAKVAPLLRLLR